MMTKEKQQHPSVEAFKIFVKEHPKLIKEVRENKRTWQQIYEEWHILGEEDEIWKPYKNQEKTAVTKPVKKGKKGPVNPELMNQVFQSLKKVDMNELQRHISGMSGAIANIQQLIEQFQTPKQQSPGHFNQQHQGGPFPFRKD